MISELLDEKSIFGKIETDFKESLSSMKEFHSDWREYDAFYLADQWNSQRASWRPDPVINYVAYTVKQKKPQLTNSRPTGLIMPTAQGDEEAAHLFTQVTDVIAERVDLDSRIEEVCGTGLLLDIAWFKVYWDNTLTGGNQARMTKWVGDVAIEAPDPANVYFDPNASRVQDCRYIIYAVPKPVKWIQEWAKSLGKTVTIQPERTFETEIYDRPGKETGKDRAMFYEYWYKENGTINCIYAANGNVLKHIKSIYRHGQYPFIPFVAEKRRKSIVGISEVRNIMNNQKLLNKLVELPTTSALLTANPIALIKTNSGIDKNKWVSKPGMVWEVKETNDAVKWLEPPSFQGDVYKLIDLMTQYIERIGGIYDANTGETPGAVTAAAAIQLLQEQGSIPIKGIARNLYASIKEVYEQMIELVKEFYTEDRVIRINGENGGYEFINFNAIQFADVDFDIKVSAGASTPTSKAYVAQLASDLFEKQLLLPSEYVEMQENLPNKDRIVARLRQAEQAPPPMPGQATTQPMGQPMMQPSLDEIYAKAPLQLQQEIDMMRQQGMPDDQILQQLMRMLNTA
ncbi:portal protein [Gorillibacterium sp. sgz5001074]|uniref:portal protein n=1 Tax=Gorillibacterium sp. sgz5001074 TaxID=3446695 RepID=UPI003F679CFF